jgi:hypothetical protein
MAVEVMRRAYVREEFTFWWASDSVPTAYPAR